MSRLEENGNTCFAKSLKNLVSFRMSGIFITRRLLRPSKAIILMSIEKWIAGGTLLITVIIATFFALLFTGFALVCFAVGGYFIQGIGLALLIIGILEIWSLVASIVLFVKGKEVGIFEK